MAIQKFRQVEGYDNLESFLGKSILGFSVTWSKVMSRTFCKCGKAYIGVQDRCDCGNPITEHFHIYDTKQSYFSEYHKDIHGEENAELKIFLKTLLFKEKDKAKTLEIVDLKECVYSIGRDYCKKNPTTYRMNFKSFDEFLHGEIQKHSYYDFFKFWYEKMFEEDGSQRAIERVFEINDDLPVLMRDPQIYQYPNLAAKFMLQKTKSHNCLKEFFESCYGNEKYMDAVNYFLMNNNEDIGFYRLSASAVFHNYKKFVQYEYPVLNDYKNLIDLINHYVLNHQILMSDALTVLEYVKSIVEKPTRPSKFPYSYKYFSGYYHKNSDPIFEDFFKVEYLEFFDTYLKENISLVENKGEFIYLFIERIKDMVEAKIPIKRDNFKIKNYNWLYTYEKMAETYKLPEDKVSLFLDWFETNPLEALELVSNRRKLTKKQLDEIIDKLSK